MSILIGDYEFDGPFAAVSSLKESRGLYAVLHIDRGEIELVYLAQAENIRDCIQVSQAASPSNKQSGKLLFAGSYTPRCGARERNIMVEEILREFAEQESDETNYAELVSA